MDRKEGITMTDAQRDELLIDISKQVKEQNEHMQKHDKLLIDISKQVKGHDKLLIDISKQIKKQNEHMQEHDKLLIDMSKQIKEQSEQIKEQNEHLKNHDNLFEKMFNEIKEVKAEQRNLSRTVAKIEVEHGEKLQILLDVVTGQEQKNKEFEKRFEDDERILDRHSDEIYYLKLKENKIKPIL